MTEDEMIALLVKRLESGGDGTVTHAWWRIVLRSFVDSPAAMARITQAGDAWRAQHGFPPGPWIVGEVV